MPEDQFSADGTDGRVKMTIDGTKYVLKRPKIKEFRLIRESLIDVARDAGASEEQTEELARSGKLDAAIITEREDELFKWWTLVFDTLEEKGQSLPPTDELPVWILGPNIVPEMMNAWLNRPARPGQ